MSTYTLASIKEFLRVVHSADDALLQDLLDGAEDEALRFLGLTAFPEEIDSNNPSSPVIPASIFVAVCCLVKADYEASADDTERLRKIAETKLQPFRQGLGV